MWRWCEGVFWGDESREAYEPIPQAAEILDAALRVETDDVESMLRFVRAWGVLGTSVPFEHSVWATRRAFREVQRHFAWAQALHRREWRSPSVPALWNDADAFSEALRAVLPPPEHGKLAERTHDERWPDLVRDVVLSDLHRSRRAYPDPYVAAFVKGHFYVSWSRSVEVRPRDREEQHWRAFGWAISEHLRGVRPALDWRAGRVIAAWDVPTLDALLWVQLWNVATGGAAIRQCRHCRKWFPVGRRGKVYCSRVCTNRASAAASYEARKRANKGRRKAR
jgi:hypothetical protein